ncbi:MAG: DoxX family protein [Marinilabiliaceae bacterium]|nr:DoxX family protein [Marinilabiliaceae bacterium]
MKIILFICRMVIAFTFIFSGFVKAVDPIGFALKIDEYLIAMHMDWLSVIALPSAIGIISCEFLLGFYLLIGFHIRKLTPLLLIMSSGFLILTFYTAVFDPVSDCGCFGDAVKLSNWDTFWKNIILMIPTATLFYFRKQLSDSGINNFRMMTTATLIAVYIVGLNIYCYNNLPIIDFRPYKIGTNIVSQMTIPEGAEQPQFETKFILEKDGEQKIFTVDDYPFDDSTWVFIDTETSILKDGYVPTLQNFAILNDNLEDITYKIVNQQGPLFLMISHNLDKTNKTSIKKLTEINNFAHQKEIPFYCLTSSDKQISDVFSKENDAWFDFMQCDETMLKTIVRSNPALLLLHDGTIAGKWHFKNIPDKEIVNNPLAYAVQELTHKNRTMIIWINIFILFIIATLFVKKTKK